MPYGLFVVSAAVPQRSAAILVNWIMQVSFDPPLVAVALESDSEMCHLLQAAERFSISMLPADSPSLARSFLKAKKNKGTHVDPHQFDISPQKPPALRAASDVLTCRVVDSFRTGDHVLFIAEVVDAVSRGMTPILTLKESGLNYSR
jgi:flavin reductase (DIM6/NTAB) family NADH-FMN oxidoreductase RutF